MKKNIFLACIIGILTAFTTNTYAGPGTSDYDNVIKQFIDGHMTTNYKAISKIMDEGAVLKMPRGESLVVESKSVLVSDMRSTGLVSQNCSSKYEILAKSAALVIARVDFEYANATQHHYLVLEKNSNKEWKITQVYKMIDDKPDMTPSNVLTNN